MTNDGTMDFSFWDQHGDHHPDWREAYSTRVTFSIAEAANILAGAPPSYSAPRGSDERISLRAKQWVETLESNIDQLTALFGRTYKNPCDYVLQHEKIRAWCAKEGIDWPIPESYIERIKSLERALEEERKLRIKAQQLADPVMSVFVNDDAPLSPISEDFAPLVLSRIESVGLNAIAQVIGGDSKELFRRYEKDVRLGAELFALLGLRVIHESSSRAPVQSSSLPPPATLKLEDPEEVYRHIDYLRADQALDWMKRISGHHVEWETLWAMVGFNMCDAFMDGRAVRGLTYAADGEFEHREVFGLGICQVMNAVRVEGAPLHLRGPAIHVDMYGLQEIEPQRAWWINDLEDYEVLFRPSDIERMGRIVTEGGGWSSVEPIEADESPADCNGSELIERLQKLQITIDNLRDQVRYCVRFDDGQLLAELGSDLLPLAVPAPARSFDQTADVSHFDEVELERLRELVATQSRLLETVSAKATEVSESAGRLVFPYSTKKLLAMRDAAVEHWMNHDRSKPAPYGIQKTIQTFLSGRTGENARKIFELANAIKPDDLPKS
ncbi:hypothetical protein KC131_03480 [Pseudomonas sp. JQ170]|uniref:hypothetical protein n=1 Tax=unclassified Pseudomonas TaxID=196821 RepID=UPI00264AA865|nr:MULTISPECIES: hypothetical protein [unclassified Pseudomonas]MDN7139695.1 hypothetical protein [Pseudomonas sp. JQ170]WRO76996.1 hypothetical protein U9R80_04765 [Pseudomonas sp. 170C]